jgi:hypothetical protein
VPKSPHVQKVPYSVLRFNRKTQKYYLPAGNEGAGRFLKQTAVRQIIDKDIEATGDRMEALGKELRLAAIAFQSGEIYRDSNFTEADYHAAIDRFEEAMAKEIKNLHLAEVAAGKGGFHAMEQSDFGRAGERIRFHKSKLKNMSQEFRENPKLLTEKVPGKMDAMRRIRMYAEAGRNTYGRVRLVEHKKQNFKSAINHLRDREHACKGERSCTQLTDKGRMPIDDMIPEGDRKCGVEDRCEVEYSMEEAA